ncbi:MAG: DUF3833 domain-containing protein [Burkholderiales bacterium]|nr:DUF3833 domain-containing protein [Burkholderiales bacterium]
MNVRRWMLLAATLLVAGCGTVPVETYRNEKPVLDLKTYFNGTVDAWGLFQDRSGKVVKRFTVRIDAKWQGDTGVLDEHFEYSDGSKSRRVWTITRIGDNRYRGTADDVVGEAIGEVSGNALRWRYVLRLDVDGRSWEVDFDDWMYQMDDRVMLNRSAMSKFGIHLGEVTLAFRKRP